MPIASTAVESAIAANNFRDVSPSKNIRDPQSFQPVVSAIVRQLQRLFPVEVKVGTLPNFHSSFFVVSCASCFKMAFFCSSRCYRTLLFEQMTTDVKTFPTRVNVENAVSASECTQRSYDGVAESETTEKKLICRNARWLYSLKTGWKMRRNAGFVTTHSDIKRVSYYCRWFFEPLPINEKWK